jgi:hypothetical protein
MMNFSAALEQLKMGAKMTRKGWNGKDMWIALQIPTPSSKMGAPYLYMSMVDGTFVPWLASQTDLMAEDWEIASGMTTGINIEIRCESECQKFIRNVKEIRKELSGTMKRIEGLLEIVNDENGALRCARSRAKEAKMWMGVSLEGFSDYPEELADNATDETK